MDAAPRPAEVQVADLAKRQNCCTRTLTQWRKPKDQPQGNTGHGHHGEASVVTLFLAGIVCGVMMFVFCCVFAEMQFGQNPWLQPAVPMGVAMQTMTAFIGAVAFSRLSGCRAVIAGPDINPLVFMADAARSISEDLRSTCELGTLPASEEAAGSSASAGGNWDACPESVTVTAVPTVLVASLIGTFLVGVFFLLLGKLRVTVVVGFIPNNVIAGFLSCIGWKVLKEAIQIACPISASKPFKLRYVKYYFGAWDVSWQYLLPALPVGVPLYLLKRKHLGTPTVNFPLFILVPTAIFYAIVFGSGATLDDARANGWLFPESNSSLPFWTVWTELYGGLANDRVSWSSLATCVPTWLVMLLIISLDHMLKLASTESSLAIDFDYNHEMKVGGVACLVTALLGGSPAYGQTKFNVLAYGMTHTTERSLTAIICGCFCGVLFLSGAPLNLYLPRFMLSGLLLFSAVGFLVENLWDTRRRFNRLNYLAVWAVFLINVIGGEYLSQFGLLIAIGTGLVWGLVAFAVHFARKSDLNASQTISGEMHCSTAYRSAAQEMKLGVLGVWYTIFKSQGTYIFFGTASLLHRRFKAHVARDASRPRCERTKMLIMDMSEVYGMDSTAGSIFQKVARLAKKSTIRLVWAGLAPTVADELRRASVLTEDSPLFATLDRAEKWVEDELLKHVHTLAQKWLVDATCRRVYNRALLHDALTSTHASNDGRIGPSQLLKWARRQFVPRGTRVLTEGAPDDGLYLLYRGLVDVHEGVNQEAHTIYPGALFNEHVLYSPPDTGALFSAIAVEDSVLLRLSHEQRLRMQYHAPHDAYQLLLSAFKQIEMRNPSRRHHTWLEQAGDANTETEVSGSGDTGSGDTGGGDALETAIAAVSSQSVSVALPADSPAPSPTATTSSPRLMPWASSTKGAGSQPASPTRHAASPSLPSSAAPGMMDAFSLAVSMRRRSSETIEPPSPTGALHRRTSKQAEVTKRMTDRDQSMRNLARQASESASEGALSLRARWTNPSSQPSEVETLAEVSCEDSSPAHRNVRYSVAGHETAVDAQTPSSRLPSARALKRTLSNPEKLRRALSREKLPLPEAATPKAAAVSKEAHDHYHRESRIIDAIFLEGHDFRVPLTPAQIEHYGLIYELNDHSGRGHLHVSELATFMDTLGHGVPVQDLESMMHDLGIDEDADGTISLSDFLEFMRRTLVADLPASKMPRVHELFAAEAANRDISPSVRALQVTTASSSLGPAALQLPPSMASPLPTRPPTQDGSGRGSGTSADAAPAAESALGELDDASMHHVHTDGPTDKAVISRAQAAKLLQALGFLLDELSLSELFDELDADADGLLNEAELITCIGMIKCDLVETLHLEASFRSFRAATNERRCNATGEEKPRTHADTKDEEDEAHQVDAADLVAALGVTYEEAEEMIFIADLRNDQRIDFTEFKQVVVNWSG